MDVIARVSAENVEKLVKKVAIQMDQTAVLGTPVDTGRARANWHVTVGAESRAEPVPDPGGPTEAGSGERESRGAGAANQALEQGRSTALRWRLGAGPIFIQNNVPYIARLEDGSSKQAPEGMMNQAFQAGIALVARASILPPG